MSVATKFWLPGASPIGKENQFSCLCMNLFFYHWQEFLHCRTSNHYILHSSGDGEGPAFPNRADILHLKLTAMPKSFDIALDSNFYTLYNFYYTTK